MLLSLLGPHHELDRLPEGTVSVPLSTLEGVRAVPWAGCAPGDDPVWLHGHAAGVYEMVEGEGRLADARRAGAASVPMRLTRRARWLSAARDPALDAVALAAPPLALPGRLRQGLPSPATAAELAARHLAPGQPWLARAVGLVSGTTARLYRGRLLPVEEDDGTRLAAALDLSLDLRRGAAALDAVVRGGVVPAGWRSLGWLRPSDRRAPRPSPPSAGAAVWAAAAEPAVRFALGQVQRAAAALAPWGAAVGPERALLVAPPEHFARVGACGATVIGPAGRDVFGELREALERALGPAERTRAERVAAPLAGDALAWQVAYVGSLWEAAAEGGRAVPGVARRFADTPHPCRALAAVLASGLVPVMLDERGAVLGIPAAVTPPAGSPR